MEEILIANGSRQRPAMREVLDAARSGGVPTQEVERSTLDALAPDHRGVVAKVDAMPVRHHLGERDLSTFRWRADAVAVILDGVEDPQNLGAAARSIEASGAQMLITRTHRAAPVTPAAVRASAGALMHLPHARVTNLSRAIERLQDAGFTVIGLDEEAERSIYEGACPTRPRRARAGQRGVRHLATGARALRSPRFAADAWEGWLAERGRVAGGRVVRLCAADAR